MQESLETKLHNYLKAQGGKAIPYSTIQYQVEQVWPTPKGGHYRMETLTRRARKDATKLENDISDRIGKIYKDSVITHFYYKTDSVMRATQPVNKDICSQDYKCFWHRKYGKCYCPEVVKVKETNQQGFNF